jgi:hypothetical protein
MTDDRYSKIHTDGSRSGGQPVVATQKAHTAMLEVLAEWGIEPRSATPKQLAVATTEALCRAIEQHEAFKQEVSDAVVLEYRYVEFTPESLQRFIIPKPELEPLEEAIRNLDWLDEYDAERIRIELDKLGFEIREKGQ